MPDAVPPIHAVSSHVATDKDPSIDGGKFKFRKTDGRRIGIRFPVFILTYVYSSACNFTSVFQIITKLAAAIFGGALYGGGVLPAQYYPCGTEAHRNVSPVPGGRVQVRVQCTYEGVL